MIKEEIETGIGKLEASEGKMTLVGFYTAS